MQFILQKYLDDLSICDELISYFHASPEKQPGTMITGEGMKVEKESKDSTDAPLLTCDLANRYYAELKKVVDAYVEEYPYCNKYAPWGISYEPNIQHYVPGGGFKSWHTERMCGGGSAGSRHLVFMTYLNDVDDAGETEFMYQNLKIKPRKGLTVVWPADWTFTHRGVPSPTQEKYVLTGWFNFRE